MPDGKRADEKGRRCPAAVEANLQLLRVATLRPTGSGHIDCEVPVWTRTRAAPTGETWVCLDSARSVSSIGVLVTWRKRFWYGIAALFTLVNVVAVGLAA